MALLQEDELCRALAPRIRVFAQRRWFDAAAVEDFVQESLLAVLQAVREGRVPGGDVQAFALMTCRGRMLDVARTRARREKLLEKLPAAKVIEPGSSNEVLVKLLPKLERRQQRVLIETFLDGRQSAEIGERMGMSEANVRVLRHRAISTLRGWLKGGEA
ncbi:MAG: sigma-70 family RNA polymerase sigma factor [Myxococcaceae bacterium]|nr:sigma-70 family RNA polymerase sigma factor [Myxococcaceae bacterium]